MTKKEYWVSFDTAALKATGILTGVKVTIETGTLDMEETARVDLADDPLYKDLHQYCLGNPPQK